jgi:hypothetical protein
MGVSLARSQSSYIGPSKVPVRSQYTKQVTHLDSFIGPSGPSGLISIAHMISVFLTYILVGGQVATNTRLCTREQRTTGTTGTYH